MTLALPTRAQLAAAAVAAAVGALLLAAVAGVSVGILSPAVGGPAERELLARYAALDAARDGVEALLRESETPEWRSLSYVAVSAELASADAQRAVIAILEQAGVRSVTVAQPEDGRTDAPVGVVELRLAFDAAHESIARAMHALETGAPVHRITRVSLVDPDAGANVDEAVNVLHVELHLTAFWRTP